MAAEATSLDKSFGTENEERTLAFVVGSMSTSSSCSSVDHSVSSRRRLIIVRRTSSLELWLNLQAITTRNLHSVVEVCDGGVTGRTEVVMA